MSQRTTKLKPGDILMKKLDRLGGEGPSERFRVTYRIIGERLDRALVFTRAELAARGLKAPDA